LEQLRALEHGFKIRVAVVETELIGIDSAEDMVKAEEFLRKRGFGHDQ
jgi:3-deoxy-manno-octulosonate cytidylyltransferase (CMP-KDO synthetase)